MTFVTHAAQLTTLLAEAAENEQFDPDKVSPGVGGFLVVALLAIALFFLGFDLVRRLRRAKYRAEIHEELAAEIAERDAAAAAAASAAADDATASEAASEAVEAALSEDEPDETAGEADPRPETRL